MAVRYNTHVRIKQSKSQRQSGTFCISIDTELLWGRKDLAYSKFIKPTHKEREIITKLLQLFRKYKIGATWAIVGKMFEKGDKLWYGADIVQEIKKTPLQEIASHSHSHPEFTNLSKRQAGEEISKAVKTAKINGVKMISFIFPRNKIAHLSILKKNGFLLFRGSDKSNLELLFLRTPPTYKPSINSGLINIPGSLYFVSARGLRKFIPTGLRFLKAKLAIDKVVKNGEVFHLWFHPVDFAESTDKLFKEFEQILIYANKKQKQGRLSIKTMAQIAKGKIK